MSRIDPTHDLAGWLEQLNGRARNHWAAKRAYRNGKRSSSKLAPHTADGRIDALDRASDAADERSRGVR